jgi:kinetochor protein Mis14/NSL1
VEIDGVARVEEMRDSWRRGTEELGRLNEGIGGTVEKMERARKAVWVVQEKET